MGGESERDIVNSLRPAGGGGGGGGCIHKNSEKMKKQ
jgi:hypothetical protein